MAKQKLIASDLVPDDKNFNLGSYRGNELLEKSIKNFGAGRSILVDKNNRIIAGNKTLEKFVELGNEEIEVIETTGERLIVVKRTDIDLDSVEGRELALADNATAVASIVFATDVIAETVSVEVMESWGVFENNSKYSSKNKEININDLSKELVISLKFNESDYYKVKDLLSKIASTPEQAVLGLLNL